jgi:hypothetical protein
MVHYKKKKKTILELHFHVIIFKNEEVRVACFLLTTTLTFTKQFLNNTV